MNPQELAIAIREHLLDLCLGSIFAFVAVCELSAAAIRRRREFLVLLWSGLFIGMYGVRLLAQATRSLSLLPHSPWPDRIDVFVTYFLLIPGNLFWIELSLGRFRRFLWWVTLFGIAVGVVGIGYFATTGSPDKLVALNNLLAIAMLVVLAVIVSVPKLSKKFLIIQSRVVTVCLPTIALTGLYYNLARFFRYEPWRNVESAGFVVWILALGYVAAQRVFANERRLLSIESELETARQIQFSILPESVPAIEGLRMAAAYHPMSAVAGDFYQFIPVDKHRAGVLIADVSGHGVPAALFASMIKVAMQSCASDAADPARVLHSLNRTLTPELRGQLISAAYLWIDTEHHCAHYSAAGHPPLLYWRNATGEVERVLSNGLLFGVSPESDYPACSLKLEPSDRFLIYTDGMVEPENVHGEAFGDRQLEQIVRDNRSHPASELLGKAVDQLREWQASTAPQLDDITLIVIDFL